VQCETVEQNLQTIGIKTFVRTEQIIWAAGTNMYTCETNSIDCQNKKLYVPNKLWNWRNKYIYTCEIIYIHW
jgi:hypothetical protein